MIQKEERADSGGDEDDPGSAFISKGVIVDVLVKNHKYIDSDEVRCMLVGHWEN